MNIENLFLNTDQNNLTVVVHAGKNPTTDFYIRPRLNNANCTYLDLKNSGSFQSVIQKHTDVNIIFCRYISRAWLSLLKKHHRKIRATALLIDDDFYALMNDTTLPLSYRARIWIRHIQHVKEIKKMISTIFVSNTYLKNQARKYYAPEKISILNPVPIKHTIQKNRSTNTSLKHTSDEFIISYHASRSHKKEFHWLLPILTKITTSLPNTKVFIIGADNKSYKKYKALPKTLVTQQISWEKYKNLSTNYRADVFLAPLLDTPVNAARTYVKSFDCAALGAAGIFADHNAYNAFINADKEDGILLTMNPEYWSRAIKELYYDRQKQQRLAKNLQTKLLKEKVS